jgi:hypothetical protein
MDVGTQQILRNNYISTVWAYKNRDAVNLLLTSYIIPKLQANELDTRKICQHYAYQVPRYNSSREPDGTIVALCRPTFSSVLGLGTALMNVLQKRARNATECLEAKIKSSGRKGFPQSILDNLIAVLKTEQRENSHYALTSRDNSRRYYYSGGMTLFKFWLKYLEMFGDDNDTLYLAQAGSKTFYPGYQAIQAVKRKPAYTDTDPMLKPSVSYDKAREVWHRYDITFEARKCDICETCFRLRCNMDISSLTGEQKAKAASDLFDHQKLAQLAIWVRTEWKWFCDTHGFFREHLQPAGRLRGESLLPLHGAWPSFLQSDSRNIHFYCRELANEEDVRLHV